MSPEQCVAERLPPVTKRPGVPRAMRCVGLWLTVVACAFTQLCAVSSKVCADMSDPGDSYGTAPGSLARGSLSAAPRARFPHLSVLGTSCRLQLARARHDPAAGVFPMLTAPDAPDQARPAISPPLRAELPRADLPDGARSGPTRALPAPHRDVAELARALRRRALLARSLMLVGGGAVSAGLIAAGLAYTANRAYAAKEPWERTARGGAERTRIERTGTVAGSLLGAGGAALVSGLALKLWDLRRADTRVEGRLTARPHKLGGMLAIQGSWGGAL